ncbi:hypothetical protein Taro_034539, partial [Colocasia esculenta]|nr:hypothetical protein [Colocasia esculenta]
VAKNGPPSVDRFCYFGIMKPLEPLQILSGKAPTVDEASSSTYCWWSHFLSDYGYAPDVSLSTELPPKSFTNEAIGCAGPLECLPFIENASTFQDIWDAMEKASRACRVEFDQLVSVPSFSSMSTAIPVSGIAKGRSANSPLGVPSSSRSIRANRGGVIDSTLPRGPSTSGTVGRLKVQMQMIRKLQMIIILCLGILHPYLVENTRLLPEQLKCFHLRPGKIETLKHWIGFPVGQYPPSATVEEYVPVAVGNSLLESQFPKVPWISSRRFSRKGETIPYFAPESGSSLPFLEDTRDPFQEMHAHSAFQVGDTTGDEHAFQGFPLPLDPEIEERNSSLGTSSQSSDSGRVRAVVRAEDLPSIEADEVRRFHATTAWEPYNREIQALETDVYSLTSEVNELGSRVDETQKRQKTWELEATEKTNRVAILQREIGDLRSSADRKVKQARDVLMQEAALSEQRSKLRRFISSKVNRIEKLKRKKPRFDQRIHVLAHGIAQGLPYRISASSREGQREEISKRSRRDLGYFFNPRIQYKDNVHNDGEVMRGIMNVITRLARTMNERLDAMAEVERYKMKLGIYGGYDMTYVLKDSLHDMRIIQHHPNNNKEVKGKHNNNMGDMKANKGKQGM